jgi:hypothetical protein
MKSASIYACVLLPLLAVAAVVVTVDAKPHVGVSRLQPAYSGADPAPVTTIATYQIVPNPPYMESVDPFLSAQFVERKYRIRRG